MDGNKRMLMMAAFPYVDAYASANDSASVGKEEYDALMDELDAYIARDSASKQDGGGAEPAERQDM